jgi:hypothetical protein
LNILTNLERQIYGKRVKLQVTGNTLQADFSHLLSLSQNALAFFAPDHLKKTCSQKPEASFHFSFKIQS